VKPEERESVRYRYSASREPEQFVNRLVTSQPDSWFNASINSRSNPVFIKELVMSPIDIQISLKTRVKADQSDFQIEEQNSAMRRLKQFDLIIPNIDKAAFRMNSLVITNIYGSPEDI